MTEPDVAITDYLLCAETLAFALGLRRSTHAAARAGRSLFLALCAASAVGGTVHGFAHDETSVAFALLWRATLLCMGGVALGLAGIAAALSRVQLRPWLLAGGVVYAVVALAVTQSFLLAIVAYLPAALWLGVVLLQRWSRARGSAELLGAAALLLTFLASALQQLRIGLHPVYFNHNALYHLIEAVAFVLLYLCLRDISRENPS